MEVSFTTKPKGYRDLYWCHRLIEPVILRYVKGEEYCINCNSLLGALDTDHEFLAHIRRDS
jgi:hypothetical protein